MRVRINKELRYIDATIPVGTITRVLSKNEAFTIQPESERSALIRARQLYEKRGIQGIFALLAGKFRWVYRGDYDIDRN